MSRMLPSQAYRASWKRFAAELSGVYEDAGNLLDEDSGTTLHAELEAMHWVPYDVIREALQTPAVDGTSENIGAITGLFFEQAVAALLVPVLRRHVAGVKIERNCCSNDAVRSIARDPDIYANADGRHAVVEIKVSPKKGNLEGVLWSREQYLTKDIGYFFVGGHASATEEMLLRFCDRTNWACILGVSDSNQDVLSSFPRFDEVADNLVEFLCGI